MRREIACGRRAAVREIVGCGTSSARASAEGRLRWRISKCSKLEMSMRQRGAKSRRRGINLRGAAAKIRLDKAAGSGAAAPTSVKRRAGKTVKRAGAME